jgi:RimJ/RimL family protein N-acetyltransferase
MNELFSKTIRLRLVEVSDAHFILSLRLDKKYNAYLSDVNADIESQKKWIEAYKIKENKKEEFYFLIERLDGTPCGTVRIYDLTNDSFCWGSWILNEKKSRYSAIESALLVYQFGFNTLNFEKSHFDVIKDNKSVISFHKKMGAVQIGENTDSYLYNIDKKAVDTFKDRIRKIIQ